MRKQPEAQSAENRTESDQHKLTRLGNWGQQEAMAHAARADSPADDLATVVDVVRLMKNPARV